ncbi:MAG: hypothetical protein WCH39_20655, partial [Schlesneria sp.]
EFLLGEMPLRALTGTHLLSRDAAVGCGRVFEAHHPPVFVAERGKTKVSVWAIDSYQLTV